MQNIPAQTVSCSIEVQILIFWYILSVMLTSRPIDLKSIENLYRSFLGDPKQDQNVDQVVSKADSVGHGEVEGVLKFCVIS